MLKALTGVACALQSTVTVAAPGPVMLMGVMMAGSEVESVIVPSMSKSIVSASGEALDSAMAARNVQMESPMPIGGMPQMPSPWSGSPVSAAEFTVKSAQAPCAKPSVNAHSSAIFRFVFMRFPGLWPAATRFSASNRLNCWKKLVFGNKFPIVRPV